MSNTTDAIADYSTYGPYSNDLRAYRGTFASNTNIADSMGYSTLPADLREDIWLAFDAAETAGGVQDLADPADMPADQHAASGNDADCTLTRPEALAVYAAKVAHAFYLEANHVFPWKLNTLSLTSCNGLFSTDELFYSWDIDGATPAVFFKVCDHSPSRAYTAATAVLSSPRNPTVAAAQLAYNGSTFAHSTTSTSLAGWSPGTQSNNIVTVDEATATGTASAGNQYSTTNSVFIARAGCHFMSAYEAALARAVNIPCTQRHAWFAPGWTTDEGRIADGAGHCTNIFPSLRQRAPLSLAGVNNTLSDRGLCLFHGDHVYTLENYSGTEESVTLRTLMNYSFYKEHGEGAGFARRNVTYFYNAQLGIDEPGRSADDIYAAGGWRDMEYHYAHAISNASIVDNFRRTIEARSGRWHPDPYNMVQFVGRSARFYYPSGLTTRGVYTPPNLEEGDLIVFAHAHQDVSAHVSLHPSGFTEIAESPLLGCGDTALTIAYKYASASEPGSYAVSSPTGNPIGCAWTLAFRNVHPTTPFAEVTTSCDTGTGNVTMPSLSATGRNEFFALCIAAKNDADLEEEYSGAPTNATVVTSPNMGWRFSNGELGIAADTGISLVGCCGTMNFEDKGQSVSLVLQGTRTAVGVPCISLLVQPPST